ncbi:MAG: GNAT family N-acetyltransferase [Burkholderiales bacterium]|jgi:CelD/BcsL family acetyltransferase involved in cellulose biosynthesis|nr:GNAT family N-acetyltransferase [Burkholderiales bacterium]
MQFSMDKGDAEMADFDFSFEPMPARERLEQWWCDLEPRSNAGFFLSWTWIGNWLEHLPAHLRPWLLMARQGGEVVGLALLVPQRRTLGKFPICQSWYLHSEGSTEFNAATVEHNDFLVDRRYGDRLRTAMLEHWARSVGRSSELRLVGLTAEGWPETITAGLRRVIDQRPSFSIDLNLVRAKAGDFTSVVSGHARRFIRRSLKEYATLGPVVVEEAQDAPQALRFFERMVALHQARWTALGETGSFKTAYRLSVHRGLIERGVPRGEVQLLRVAAGQSDIGYLYSFVRGDHLYVFQSGFDYGLLEKHGRPGLVTHTLGVQHNAAKGFRLYDLMAGESQYKQTIATHTETMTWLVLRKPSLRFAAESAALTVLKRWRAWRDQRNATGASDSKGAPTAEQDDLAHPVQGA